jgi:hypothetical protein
MVVSHGPHIQLHFSSSYFSPAKKIYWRSSNNNPHNDGSIFAPINQALCQNMFGIVFELFQLSTNISLANFFIGTIHSIRASIRLKPTEECNIAQSRNYI